MVERMNASGLKHGAVGQVLVPRDALRLIKEIDHGQVTEAHCVVCSAGTVTHPELVGEPECLCHDCAADSRAVREGEQREADAGGVKRAQFIRQKLERTGLADRKRMIEALKIGTEHPGGVLKAQGRYRKAAEAVLEYLASELGQGTLIIGGPTGSGKSTAAALAAWRTGGRFIPRSSWRSFPVRAQGGAQELRFLAALPGVMVLDDCLAVAKNGDPADSDWEAEVIWALVGDRHEAGRPTVLTTQASDHEIRNSYGTRGEAIVRRAMAGATDLTGKQIAGGFRWCAGR